jgi:hypothetical protein
VKLPKSHTEALTRYEILGISGVASPEMEAAITGELR